MASKPFLYRINFEDGGYVDICSTTGRYVRTTRPSFDVLRLGFSKHKVASPSLLESGEVKPILLIKSFTNFREPDRGILLPAHSSIEKVTIKSSRNLMLYLWHRFGIQAEERDIQISSIYGFPETMWPFLVAKQVAAFTSASSANAPWSATELLSDSHFCKIVTKYILTKLKLG